MVSLNHRHGQPTQYFTRKPYSARDQSSIKIFTLLQLKPRLVLLSMNNNKQSGACNLNHTITTQEIPKGPTLSAAHTSKRHPHNTVMEPLLFLYIFCMYATGNGVLLTGMYMHLQMTLYDCSNSNCSWWSGQLIKREIPVVCVCVCVCVCV